jgi:hypothetical protein
MPTVQDYYNLPAQYSLEDYTTAGPEGDQQAVSYAPGYIPELLDLRRKVLSGQASAWEREWYQQQANAAMAVPLRDVGTLTYNAGEDAPDRVSGGSPDLGNLMLTLQAKLERGQASDQERQLFSTTLAALRDQNYRASVPQESDRFSIMGDNLLGAMAVLGLGATGGLAGGALAAGGGLASTLGSLGTLSGIAGTGAGVLGQATDQDWLSQLGLGLGIAGGLAGGLGGLSNLWSSGVGSLSDAAKLAQSAGKIAGSLGRIPGADPLKDVSRYLGYAGQAGQFGAGLGADDWLGWSGDNAPLAQNVAPQVNSNVSNLLSAADMATQRGDGNVADFSYEDFLGWGDPNAGDPWNSPMPADTPGWEDFTGWGGDETQTGWYQNANLDTSGQGGLWNTILGGLGGAGKLLLGGGTGASSSGGLLGGGGAGLLGPLLASLGSVGGGAIGSNAANEAARLQSQALNRGIDLSTSQWLQQQARTQPWVQAGQQALGTLQGLAGQQLPGLPGATAGVSGANYALPGTTPGWSPQQYQGPQGPNAADYHYSAPATVDPSQYAWNPQAAMDSSQYAFSAPNGQELLSRDPGYAFRQEEARKAIDASAAARGGLLSGSTLGALQRQSQDLASQEYQNAYNRALGENQLRYGRGLTQTQEDYQRQLAANQLGYGRATEQQQLGYQQGLGAQGFNWQTALQGQQNQFNQGITAQQWEQQQRQKYETDMYQRMLEQQKMRYGMDVSQNATDYERQQALYKQQLAQSLLPWEQNATLASLGAQVTGQLGNQGIASSSGISNLLGQLGSAQAGGATNQANSWMNALQNVGNAGQGYLQNQSLLSALANLNR